MFGKGQYAFYPLKLSLFAKQNKVCWKYLNFTRGVLYKLGQRPLRPTKNYKVINFFFWGWGSGLPYFMNPFVNGKKSQTNYYQ